MSVLSQMFAADATPKIDRAGSLRNGAKAESADRSNDANTEPRFEDALSRRADNDTTGDTTGQFALAPQTLVESTDVSSIKTPDQLGAGDAVLSDDSFFETVGEGNSSHHGLAKLQPLATVGENINAHDPDIAEIALQPHDFVEAEITVDLTAAPSETKLTVEQFANPVLVDGNVSKTAPAPDAAQPPLSAPSGVQIDSRLVGAPVNQTAPSNAPITSTSEGGPIKPEPGIVPVQTIPRQIASTQAPALPIVSGPTVIDAVAQTPVEPNPINILDGRRDTPARVADTEIIMPKADTVRAIELPAHSTNPIRLGDMPAFETLPNTLSQTTALTPSAQPALGPVPVMPVVSAVPQLQLNAPILSTPLPTVVSLDKIPQAVVTVAMSAKSATLQIDPPELGRIQLDYQFDTQGRTVVTMIPETEAARAALSDRMASIIASLEQNTSGEVEVRVGESQDFMAHADRGDQADNDGGDNDLLGGSDQPQDSNANPAVTPLNLHPADGQDDRLHILV